MHKPSTRPKSYLSLALLILFCATASVWAQQTTVTIAGRVTDQNTGQGISGVAIAGSANPENVQNWAQWIEEPIDRELLKEVLEILAPVKDIGHVEGLPRNN